eukprot:49401-Rhodomonas_salina.1
MVTDTLPVLGRFVIRTLDTAASCDAASVMLPTFTPDVTATRIVPLTPALVWQLIAVSDCQSLASHAVTPLLAPL